MRNDIIISNINSYVKF